MDIGKLPNDVLKEKILRKIRKINDEVVLTPSIGEDCAAVKFGDEFCVITSDPVTAATKDIGKIGVIINSNDIASSGVRPLGITVTLLAPPYAKIEDIEAIMEDVIKTCEEFNIDILGGHTEITDAVNRYVLSITAIGKGKSIVKTKGAKVGDDVVMTGFAGLEGTYIIVNEYYDKLLSIIDKDILDSVKKLQISISVLKAGLIAGEFKVNSMHDATEGGILGALWEVANASDRGIYIYKDKIPVLNETKIICKSLNIDPYKLISSGAMIITTEKGEELVKKLNEYGIHAAIIGKITEKGCIINDNGIEYEIEKPLSDEIYKVKF
ncbi:Hydrogenase maturation factor [Caloramator fervidus]|uniref:Hydrogenase maturation factor n=1 Tax=Caloramator fervidus TaxID=29344 RepID=A0A1H5VA86_9CLOT|nr:AIR synthase family protein [Caloramator fervidus]SEF84295.1 Hydrogenase maturation factor [Caloramator fervidus]